MSQGQERASTSSGSRRSACAKAPLIGLCSRLRFAGTIYRYFASKEALVNALYRGLKQSLSEQVLTHMVAEAAPRRQFAVYFGGMCRFLIEQPKAFAFLELHHHASYLDDESLAVENQMVDLATSVFERAQRQGAIKKGPAVVLMAIVYGALVGFARAGLEKRIEFTDENQALAEECCWAAIAA